MLLTYTSGVSNIVTNVLVLAVPVPLLLRAVLTRQQKVGLTVLYLFGATVILASALRFATQLLDVSLPQAMGWSQMELSLALLLACAPMAVKLLFVPLVGDDRGRRDPSPKDCKDKWVGVEVETGPGPACSTPKTAALDTPTFVRRLLMERDAIITAAPAAAATTTRPQRRPRVSAAAGAAGASGASGEGGEDRAGKRKADHRKLRLVREEVDGQSVWEVSPSLDIRFRPVPGAEMSRFVHCLYDLDIYI